MPQTMRFANLLIAIFVLILCTSSSSAARGAAAAPTGALVSEPSGFNISGYIRTVDGQGLPGVLVYLAFAFHLPGAIVATSGADGFYQSTFGEVPSIETVTVHPAKPCYTFLPESVTWMHYGGRYEKTINFTAYPACSRYYLPFVQRPWGEEDPGLIFSGYVRTASGQGIPGVKIYRGFASYQGQVVATTSFDGSYQAPFVFIPGDEMVSVYAELEGYTFSPELLYWRHYYGHEVKTINFVGYKP